MKKGCVSVIVPVYNQEHCIEACLNSIIGQSYDNLQIIVIDDGSSDRTGGIIDQISQRDHRIEAYHVKNQGVSNTRNYGLFRVKGEYVQFVDADDRLDRHMIGRFVSIMNRQKADMVICNYIKQFQRIYLPNRVMERPGRYTASQYLTNTLCDPGHHYYGVVWNKLYRADLIAANNLRFQSDITLGEDFVFNIKYWQNCDSVYVDWRYLYLYSKVRDFTLSNIKNKKLENCISELENRRKIYDVYYEAIRRIDRHNDTEEKLWRYWIIFYVRQKYSLKYEYLSWNASERKCWHDMICRDENIRRAFGMVSDKWIKEYTRKYAFETDIKKCAKRLLHVS